MAKLTLTDLVNLENPSAVTAINNNNAEIETAMEKTLSRDGTAPNSMNANLDMNSYRIINLPAPGSDTEPVRLVDIQGALVPDIFAQASAPATSGVSGSLWVDTDSADVDLYQLTGGVWVDTGVNMKGPAGVTGAAGANGSLIFVQTTAPTTDKPEGSLWIDSDDPAQELYQLQSSVWVDLGIGVKGTSGSGTGDVVGPASSTNNDIAIFSGTTGKLIADGGKTLPAGAVVGTTDTQTLTNKTVDGTNNTFANVPASVLGVMTGDSGAGGAKGAVPAPAAGDAAANKFLKASGAWATVSASGSPPGKVYMYHDGSAWQVKAPDGSAISTSGTTTDGLQEAINYAQTNGWDLEVVGRSVTAAGSQPAIINCTSQVTIGPATYRTYSFSGCVINWTSFAGTCLQLDTLDYCTVNMDCVLQRSGGASSSEMVFIYPASTVPLHGSGHFQNNIIRIRTMTQYSTGTPRSMISFYSTAGHVICNNRFEFGIINCADLTDHGILMFDPQTSGMTGINDNHIEFGLIGSWKVIGIAVGQTTFNASFPIADNVFHGSMENATAAASHAVKCYGLSCSFYLSSIDVNSGTMTTGVEVLSGANNCVVICPHIVATTNAVVNGATGTFLIYNGNITGVSGGGSSSVIAGSSSATVAAASTVYICSAFHTTSSLAGRIRIPRSGTLQKMYITATAVPGSGQTYTATLYKNGASTALTAQIAGAAATDATDTTNTVSVAAGDLISVQFVTSATANAAYLSWSMELA